MATSRNQSDLGSKLLSLKKRLEEQKSQRHELQGELNSLTKQMEQDFGIKTIDQAEKQIKKMQDEIEKMEKSIMSKIRQIEMEMEGR